MSGDNTTAALGEVVSGRRFGPVLHYNDDVINVALSANGCLLATADTSALTGNPEVDSVGVTAVL